MKVSITWSEFLWTQKMTALTLNSGFLFSCFLTNTRYEHLDSEFVLHQLPFQWKFMGFRVHFVISWLINFNLSRLFCDPNVIFEPPHVKTNKMTCAPSKDSDQPGHPPSLIRVFAVRMNVWALSYPLSAQRRLWPDRADAQADLWTQRRLWSDWADAQADLSLRLAHIPFCWFCHEAAHFLEYNLDQLKITRWGCLTWQ